MAAIKEWGTAVVPYDSLNQDTLEMKITFCEEVLKIVAMIEGDMSRTKGFVLQSLLETLDYMKQKEIHISQVRN